MIRIRGVAEIAGMATVAVGRHRLVRAHRLVLVARGTIHGRVRSQQRKTIIVLLNPLNLRFPSLYRMALLAVGAQLALVDVGMAIRAARSGIRKHRLDMALGTSYRFVHPAQREFGAVVVEFRRVADRLPAHCGMAVLARDIQWAMGTAAVGRRRLRRGHRAKDHEVRYRQLEFHCQSYFFCLPKNQI